jgi:hypothetical protein
MFEIHIESTAELQFRILSSTADVKLVIFMVQDHEAQPVWVVTPAGTAVSQYDAFGSEVIEYRESTPDDRRVVENLAPKAFGDLGVPVATVQYGVVPPGLSQALPLDAPAPALLEGHRYEAVVVSNMGELSSVEFLAAGPVV